MAVQVTLEDHTGNVSHQAKMDEQAQVGHLIPAIITALSLPITDSAGRPITYHLSHNNRRLQESETLAEAEVRTGDTLVIVPEMTAGSRRSTTADGVVPPLVELDSGVRKLQPAIGFPSDYQVTIQASVVQISLQPDMMHRVWTHAKSYPHREVGGILLGNVFEENGRFLVNVEQALVARHTLAGLTFVTFTDRAWLDLLQRRHRHPSLFVIGWYHSHPGFGIFLSPSDEFIHRRFFGDRPWYLALVVDPISDEWGVFAWENGDLKRCREC